MKTKGPYSSRIMLGRYNYNIIISVAIYRHQTISVTVQDQAPLAVISYLYYYSISVYTRNNIIASYIHAENHNNFQMDLQ